jgi:hypothetical protein
MSLRTIKDTNLGRVVKRGARNEYQMGSQFLRVIFELDIDPVRQMLSFRENGGERDQCWHLCGAFSKQSAQKGGSLSLGCGTFTRTFLNCEHKQQTGHYYNTLQ